MEHSYYKKELTSHGTCRDRGVNEHSLNPERQPGAPRGARLGIEKTPRERQGRVRPCRFGFRRRSAVSIAPPHARVPVPPKIVPSLSPYRAPGRSLPSCPPRVERLRQGDDCFSTRAAMWPPIGCVGTSAGGRTALRRSSLRGAWSRSSELSLAVRLNAGSCSTPQIQTAEPVTAVPRAVTRDPRPDPFSLGPRAPGPARAARREDERRAAEGGAAAAAAGQWGPESLCLEQGAAKRRGLGGQGAVAFGEGLDSRNRLGFAD